MIEQEFVDYEEGEVITLSQEQSSSSQALTVQPSMQVEINTPEELLALLEQIVLQKDFTYHQRGIQAVQAIPWLAGKVQMYTIGLGRLLSEIAGLWDEYYRDQLLDAGPEKRDGFYEWAVDTFHYPVSFIRNTIEIYEVWMRAKDFEVTVEEEDIAHKPLSPFVTQLANTKLARAQRKLDMIQDDQKLSKAEKAARSEEIEEATREEVAFLFTAPEHMIIQEKKKEEKGTRDRVCLVLEDVQYSENRKSMGGYFFIEAQGDVDVETMLQDLHRGTKDNFYWKITLKKNHMKFNDPAALVNHMNSLVPKEDGLYADEEDDVDYEEEEDEEYEGDEYEEPF